MVFVVVLMKKKLVSNKIYFAVTSDYWVLATDYDSYALVYSCKPVDDEYVQGM